MFKKYKNYKILLKSKNRKKSFYIYGLNSTSPAIHSNQSATRATRLFTHIF